ncbi:9957_t:CDS:2 [Scutellospora calospora]|uniref:9957_t:CDS:1 n=1 Tax=Scutellospora calospora TaxID=85575 RepID=A0ACA9K9X8_9GLOM|nr:9957_t:CDS:2 [Scutellospora calospora]
MQRNNIIPISFAEYLNGNTGVVSTNNVKKKNNSDFKPVKQQKKESNIDEKEKKNELMDDEKIELNKEINKLEKENDKLTKDRNNIIKKLFKLKETLESLSKRKIINEDIIKEIEKTSKSTLDFPVKNNKKSSIKDKTISKDVRQQQKLSFFQKQLRNLSYQNLKNASNKSTSINIPNLPCDIICDLEEISEDDDFGSFNTEVVEITDEKLDGGEIKYGKNVYIADNIATNSLIMVNKFSQSFSKDLPKASKLRLHGFFNEINMSIVLNTGANSITINPEQRINIYEPPGNFIVILAFLIGKKTGDPNEKENERNFLFMKNNIELQDIFKKGTYRFDNTDGMPYGVKRADEENGLIIYCCDKETITNTKGQQSTVIGYQPNVIWVLTVTFAPDIMKKNIENSLRLPNMEYNNDITFFGSRPKFPIHSGPFLIVNKAIPIMAYETNIDSVSNLKQASGSALKQLVDAIKYAIENPDVPLDSVSPSASPGPFDPSGPSDASDILRYYNKKINEKTKFIDLQPKSKLYDQIQKDDRLGPWQIKELNNNIKQKGNELIEKFITRNIESICHKYVNYDTHNKIINEYKPENISTCQYPIIKNNFDRLFNIIWDEYMLKHNLMSAPIYLSGINKYGDYVDKQNNKNRLNLKEITYDNFKSLLENDQKDILDYCEAGKYEKIINSNEILKKHSLKLHKIRKNICERMKEELPEKETFLINFMKNNKNSNFLINHDNLNPIDTYWIFKKIDKLNVNIKDKNFNKMIISTFIKDLNKCNQEYENICVPEILKIIKSEINCKELITNGLYDSLLKDENFNKLVKLNINEINEIHHHIAIQKTKLKTYCMTDFIIDEFSTNNRFENFFNDENMDRLMKLEKKTNMNEYIDRLLTISESLKNNELYYPESPNLFSEFLDYEKDLRKDYIKDNGPIDTLIKSSNIPNDAKINFEKRRLEILHRKIPEPEKLKEPKHPKDPEKILFDELKRKIKNHDKDNADKLLNYGDLEEEINNASLSNDKIEKLQQLRNDRLNELISEKINELENKIRISKTQGEIDDISD